MNKQRRPSGERRAIRQIMEEKGLKYTAALREYEKRQRTVEEQ